jgi:cytochrome c peroxidase
MTCWLLLPSLAFAALAQITPAPAGPYRVEGNRILDSQGRPFLIRGTRLPPVTPESGPDFGPFSGTSLVTLRQRLNMNAVRLPIDDRAYAHPRYRWFVKKLVQQANRLELLAILETGSAAIAADYKENPNVFFAVPDREAAAAIRAQGAEQPIVVVRASGHAVSNLIYQTGSYNESLPNDVALLADGFDPELGISGPPCAAFPADPAEASKRFEDLLTRFDQRAISWTISALEPGKLIDNYRGYDWSKLDDGWTCGAAFSGAGIGMVLLAHLWHADPHGIFTVNQPGGGMVIARGANASTYGRILADRETAGPGYRLSNISIRVIDSRGVSRPAKLLWTGAGWSSANLVIPENSATGPAQVVVLRADGSQTAGGILVADAAPALWTATGDGRGPVVAQVRQGGAQFPAWRCTSKGCRTVPIPLAPGVSTTVRIDGTGFRHASAVQVWIDGMQVPVESFGAIPGGSRDEVTVKIPDPLAGRGEVDLYMVADRALSNVVRIDCGESGHDKIQLGRYLFYDKRMSVNGKSSCASCHRQELAFTDGRAHAVGATEQVHPRSAMSLVNLSFNKAFNWNDPAMRTLEQQALKPMRSRDPVELGVDETSFVKQIRADAVYRPLFREAFPRDADPFTIASVIRAIAAFERTITSVNSPYDRFHRDGDQGAITESAKRGEILFYLDGPSCFRCHSGTNFSDSAFHNNGLGAAGRFKTPTLRNIAITGPYMHDGSLATLEDVVDHYASGGKAGHDPIMRGFHMTPRNRVDLAAFLQSLTDEDLLLDARFGNPWP